MRRIPIAKRNNLAARAAETGFALLEIDGAPYWDESAYYGFSLQQIEGGLEDPTSELAAMCRELVSRAACDEHILKRLQIPEIGWPMIGESWKRGDPALYGRFDLAYDGNGPAQLLEYNADTPTALFESAVFQWLWLEDVKAAGALPAGADQFNSVHEALIERLKVLRQAAGAPKLLYLTCDPQSAEDQGFINYLADCAIQAGFYTSKIALADIGNTNIGPFVDLNDNPIELLFKLYPWEWMLSDPFSKSPSMRNTRFIEPAWKAVLSNKGLLPLLWEMAPGHPNLLPAYFEDDPKCTEIGGSYARKPIHSREGENVELYRGGALVERSEGDYAGAGFIVQELAELPCCSGNYPVVGSWVVGDKACGIGIREDRSPITRNTSRFVPHAILP